MKEALIIPFVLFSLATWSSWSSADQGTIPQSHELSRDRHAQQDGLKHGHSHDVKPKSKYDLRNIDGIRGGDGHKHVHEHGHHHDLKAKSKYDLRNTDRHDHGAAHRHYHGDAHKYGEGDGHKHEHGDAHLHDRGNGHGAHDDHGHAGHGHGHGHGGHEHGYDRVWNIGISG